MTLKGVKKLTINDQKIINGGTGYFACGQQSMNTCCQLFPSGFILCEPGRCIRNSSRCSFF